MKKILGIGNALVDILVNITDESILSELGLCKGGMEMIDSERKNQILNAIADFKQTVATGGSTSNTIHGLARLGSGAGYVGNIGRDKLGDTFLKGCTDHGVMPHLIKSDVDTGVAITFITPDAERTFATYLGAASTMNSQQIDFSIFDNYDIIHVEGYLIFNHELILEVCKQAKLRNLMISMDMASYNIIEEHYDFVEMLLRDYVDIIFANEEEAKAFTQKEGESALKELSKYCNIAIVKIGKDGSLIQADGQIVKIAPVEAKRVDTTGAGDIYASGFLYGLSNGYSTQQSGDLASFLSAKLIEYIGAKLPDSVWTSEELKSLL